MGSIETFSALRALLLSIGYRMLGESADAEDAVQEAWLRWEAANEADVRDPKAWLSTTVTRICLDRLKAVRRRREDYPGPWLPEPVVTDEPIDRESISLAFLVLLERLTPVERAVYLLHNVFECSHAEVARTLGLSEGSVRQSHHRAKEHVAANRPRFAPTPDQHERILIAFMSAVSQGDEGSLKHLLAEEASLWADGGGKVRGAAGRPVFGREEVARFLASFAKRGLSAVAMEIARVNGWPAIVARLDGRIVGVINIETDGEWIFAVRSVINPDKLALQSVN
jgi:RNA polymerase sigma-70 factor (ECF subfamily)